MFDFTSTTGNQILKNRNCELIEAALNFRKPRGAVISKLSAPLNQVFLRKKKMRPGKEGEQMPAVWVIPCGSERY